MEGLADAGRYSDRDLATCEEHDGCEECKMDYDLIIMAVGIKEYLFWEASLFVYFACWRRAEAELSP